jgi:hypothetical protein
MENEMTRLPDGSHPGDGLRMMRSPDLWPHGHVLMLKRKGSGLDLSGCGVLFAVPGVPPTRVYKLNLIFDNGTIKTAAFNPAVLADIEHEDYDDFEGILDAGWMVD